MILAGTDTGAGPPVALLHGLFGRRQNFGMLARALAGAFRVIALDLRNHGESPHAADMDYASMAADVRETLALRGALPAAAVLGHSMGGKVAMALALAHPGEVRRLLVADIAPVAYRHTNAAVAAAMRSLPLTAGLTRREAERGLEGAVPAAAVRSFLVQNIVWAPPGEVPRWRIGLDAIARAMPALESWPEEACVQPYGGPALFLRGGASDFVTAEHWPAVCRCFPAARLHTLPGAGHWLHADQPAEFAAQVAEFLSPLLRR